MKYLTKEWFQKIQADNDSPEVQKAIDDCTAEYKINFPTPPEFMEAISCLHDSEITLAGMIGKDFIIKVENIELSPVFTDVVLILKNATVKKKDFDMQKIGWCYEELYPTSKGYELHCLLFEYGSNEMYELIVDCEDIEVFGKSTFFNEDESLSDDL